MRRIGSEAAKAAQFSDLRVGDTVSFHGSPYVIIKHLSTTANSPAKCLIRASTETDAAAFVAKYADLYRMADQRPELSLKAIVHNNVHEVGALAFYTVDHPSDSNDTIVYAGVIESATADGYTIHRCRQAQKDEKRFTRLYAHPNGAHKPHVKTPLKKTGAVAIIDEVPRVDVFLSGPYSNTGRTDDATLRSVRAAGCSVVYEDELNASPTIAMPTLNAYTPPLPPHLAQPKAHKRCRTIHNLQSRWTLVPPWLNKWIPTMFVLVVGTTTDWLTC